MASQQVEFQESIVSRINGTSFKDFYTYGLRETILKVLHAVLHIGCLLRQDNHRRGHVLVSALIRRATDILHGKPARATPNNLRYGGRQRVDLLVVRRSQQARLNQQKVTKFPFEEKENSNNNNNLLKTFQDQRGYPV